MNVAVFSSQVNLEGLPIRKASAELWLMLFVWAWESVAGGLEGFAVGAAAAVLARGEVFPLLLNRRIDG